MSVPWLKSNNSAYTLIEFRPNHSTNSALIEITEQIRKACDKGPFACGVYLDLKKSFDTWHSKPQHTGTKLEYYGIKGNANYWLRSFLTDRKQYTSVTGKDSKFQEITHGVLQGSVLGHLLFILFINDFNLSVTSSKVHHFADDTNLLLINKSLKKVNSLINHDLALLVQWLRANKKSLKFVSGIFYYFYEINVFLLYFEQRTLKRNLTYCCFFFPLFHEHLFSLGLPCATRLVETSCVEKVTVCVIETMLVTFRLSRSIKHKQKWTEQTKYKPR